MEPGTIVNTLAVWLFIVCVFLGIAAPGVVVNWARRRREEAIRRQIALTDAIHSALGPIVSPVVKKPLWGSWQILIPVPLARPAAVGQVVRLAHAVLPAADRLNPDGYEIVLIPQQEAAPPAKRPLDPRRVAA